MYIHMQIYYTDPRQSQFALLERGSENDDIQRSQAD